MLLYWAIWSMCLCFIFGLLTVLWVIGKYRFRFLRYFWRRSRRIHDSRWDAIYSNQYPGPDSLTSFVAGGITGSQDERCELCLYRNTYIQDYDSDPFVYICAKTHTVIRLADSCHKFKLDRERISI